jgi:hypothetical protein
MRGGGFCLTIAAMAADAFIQCRVAAEIKARVRTLAQRDRITESALVKQLLGVILRSSAAAGVSRLAPHTAPRDVRHYDTRSSL